MNVASLELSKELYELSGWGATGNIYWRDTVSEPTVWFTDHAHNDPELQVFDAENKLPAYDLGYLLRKLPDTIDLDDDADRVLTLQPMRGLRGSGRWDASYDNVDKVQDSRLDCFSDTPEDSAAMLAIELFKQGVLTRGGDDV